ncbi:EDD domain protein, DegV family [Desulforamulus putei DSM 12395]|uniref:EDD domain protein, DegV family n=1 Tax=Desulforamulus putei DSM 12395 TaxID=1121429 RepID=A0A1M5CVU3_9FIRM|nr:DegV family protein [Desulforamulus putei]SHF58868.1 EDD domain protein, DegV family [Desulforamulus putei DSM 12395]
MKLRIMTDSNCDLPLNFIKENEIIVAPFPYFIKDQNYNDDFGKSIGYKEFYEAIRRGEMPKTSQITPFVFEEYFRTFLEKSNSIIYIAFSSALSQTYNNALIARDIIMKKNPTADISVIDSRSATVGQGLLVFYASEMLKQGKTKEEIVRWIESNKHKVNHWFTVDDLAHLKRGGRISSTSAVLGTILEIKPVLFVDNQGGLTFAKKVKGRRKAIKALAEELQNRIINAKEQTIFICHRDCLEDAEFLKNIILDKIEVKNVIVNYAGPIVGAHTGPGMLAVTFLGENRTA